MSHILIVGKKFSSLTEYLNSNGHSYTVLQDAHTTKSPDKKIRDRILGDFSSKESIIASLDQLETRPDGVITVYENYIRPTAWIAEHLGLLGLPISAAEACTDKFLMRSLFDKAPEKISPGFATIKTEQDVRLFAENHSFPLILKPANLAKSLLVTKSLSLDELLENYQKSLSLLDTVYEKYAPGRKPKLIIEEFLEGSIHSVDAFVDKDGVPFVLEQIVDYQTGYDIGYDDNFHYSRLLPSTLSADDQKSLRHCAEVGIRALGMKNSPAHVEIIMTKDGPRIVEIGARNGGYRERMHTLANGLDIIGNSLRLILGLPINVHATRDDSCAVLELFPKTPGVFTGIANEHSLKKLSSLSYLSIKPEAGQFVGKSADGHKMCAIIILHNEDKEQFQKDLDYVNSNVSVVTS